MSRARQFPASCLILGLLLPALAPAKDVFFDVGPIVSSSFGHAAATSDATTLFGAPREDAVATDSGAVYVYEELAGALQEVAKWTPATGSTGALFGTSLGVDGDWAAVGAPGAGGSGAVHLFERVAGAWQFFGVLTAADGSNGDLYGQWVALQGSTLLVGAPGHDHAGTDAGAVYVYARSGSTWFQQAELLPPSGSNGDAFGAALGLDGDWAVIGAPQNDAGGSGAGTAYVTQRSGSGSSASWSSLMQLTAMDTSAGDAFGCAVSLSGTRALIGAPGDDDQGTNSGSAYVFEQGPSGGWNESAKLVALDGAPQDGLGSAVHLYGASATLGAPWDDDQGVDSGSAYGFEWIGAAWSQSAKYTRAAGQADQLFGWSVGGTAQLLAIGAPGPAPLYPEAGDGWIKAPCWYGSEDCNDNGTKDWCDIENGSSKDCNENWIPDECDPFMCRAEIVFLMDTSSSMFDESDTLCAEIMNLECQLYGMTLTQVNTHYYGISDLQFSQDSDCNGAIVNTVLAEFGNQVPDNPPCCGVLDDCSQAGGQIASGPRENWGPAVTIVADAFDWTPGALRLIVPITDEAAWCGNPCENPDGDEEIVQHAIGVCNQNFVIVSPVMGDGAAECVVALANLMADGTGGSVFQSENAQADLIDGIAEIVNGICGPAGDHTICHGTTACPCGNDAPAGSGAGCVNSTGQGAAMDASGSTSLSADDLVLNVNGLPAGQYGLIFMGPGLSTPMELGDGGRCVASQGGTASQSGLWRYAAANSGSGGLISLGSGIAAYASAGFGSGGQLLAGESWNFQLWYRDPMGPCGSGSNLSNGVRATFTP